MDWKLTFISLMLTFTVGNALNKCDYQYRYLPKVPKRRDTKQSSSNQSTGLDNIQNNAKYTQLLSKNGSLPTGVFKVNITLPNADCRYKVALLVNDTIKNDTECSQHNFTNLLNKELHSTDQTICVAASNEYEEKGQKNGVFVYFEHVYTGCYALRFTKDDYNYVVRSRTYIRTDYRRTEVEEPTFHCNYDNRKDINQSRDLVTFTFAISVLSGSSSMILKLIPLLSSYENKQDACIKYSNASEHAWKIDLVHANGTLTKDIECNFALPVPYNESYCFLITLNDKRCWRNTAWDPPPRDNSSVSCSWMSKCTRMTKTRGVVEYNGELTESKIISSADTGLILPIAVGFIILILLISATILSIYNTRARRGVQQSYLTANLRDLRVMSNIEGDGNDTDDENEKIAKTRDDLQAIVLMYARGPKAFMAFMADYREILKLYCGCHVFDWYAACEWDTVAKAGACDWAIQLFKKNCRIVWIDTPAARILISDQVPNNSTENDGINVLSDFRDTAFPAVLDYAKRSTPKSQYNRHFIVRLEGYDNASTSEDPFADLSPYARYLIPYHLNQLCSHISSRRSDSFGNALITEEAQLRERLIQIKSEP